MSKDCFYVRLHPKHCPMLVHLKDQPHTHRWTSWRPCWTMLRMTHWHILITCPPHRQGLVVDLNQLNASIGQHMLTKGMTGKWYALPNWRQNQDWNLCLNQLWTTTSFMVADEWHSGLNFIMSDKKYMVAISDKVVLIQWAEFCWRSYNFQTTISFIIADEWKGLCFLRNATLSYIKWRTKNMHSVWLIDWLHDWSNE